MKTKLFLIALIFLSVSLSGQSKKDLIKERNEYRGMYRTLLIASDSAKRQTDRELKVNRYTKMYNEADSAFNSVVSKEKQVNRFKSQLKAEDVYINHLTYATYGLYEDRILYLLINDLITIREYLFLIRASEELAL